MIGKSSTRGVTTFTVVVAVGRVVVPLERDVVVGVGLLGGVFTAGRGILTTGEAGLPLEPTVVQGLPGACALGTTYEASALVPRE